MWMGMEEGGVLGMKIRMNSEVVGNPWCLNKFTLRVRLNDLHIRSWFATLVGCVLKWDTIFENIWKLRLCVQWIVKSGPKFSVEDLELVSIGNGSDLCLSLRQNVWRRSGMWSMDYGGCICGVYTSLGTCVNKMKLTSDQDVITELRMCCHKQICAMQTANVWGLRI